MLRSDEANGWNSGGCGFCTGLGTTDTARTMPSVTPPPYFAVASSVQGVSPAGTRQNLPSTERKSSVQARFTIWKHSSNASRFASSIASCWCGSAP